MFIINHYNIIVYLVYMCMATHVVHMATHVVHMFLGGGGGGGVGGGVEGTCMVKLHLSRFTMFGRAPSAPY